MSDYPDGWGGDWAGKVALVLGCGDVGFAMADTLHELGCHTTVVTDTVDGDQEKILRVLGVTVVDNARASSELPSTAAPDIVLLSAPVFRSHPLAVAAAGAGACVWSEVEFAHRVADKSGSRPRFVFLAGYSHGSPIADLARELCHYAGLRAIVVGSMGAGVLDVLRDPLPWEVVLWPMGQGELVDLFHDTDPMRSPFISVALDAETTLSAEAVDQVYFRTERACLYSRSSGLTERSLENAWVQEGCRAIGIGLDTPGMSDFGVVDGIVCDRAFVEDRRHRALELTTVQEAHDGGFADQEGIGRLITALAIARALDVTPEEIGGALRGLSS